MAEVSYFWTTNGTGDGTSGGYTAANFSQYLEDIAITDASSEGVLFGVDNSLAVSTTGVTRQVSVASGAAIVNGKYYKTDAAVLFTLDSTPSSRVDRVILRGSYSAQTVRLAILKGSDGSASPTALTQSDGTTWEILLANVSVNSANVLAITDQRTFVKSPTAYGWFNTPLTLNSTLTVSSNATVSGDLTVSGGDIRLGADVDLRRSAANTLTIDDVVVVEYSNNGASGMTISNPNTGSSADTRLVMQVASSASSDPFLQFRVADGGVVQTYWTVGSDNSDADNFKVANGINLGTGTRLTIDSASGLTTLSSLSTSSGTITNATLGTATITTLSGTGIVGADNIAAGAVTNAKIGALAVDAAKIASNAVETAKINASAVTSAKISDGAVETAKLAAGAIVTTSIAANVVTSAKLAANAVVTTSITDASVTNAKIASVDWAKIASAPSFLGISGREGGNGSVWQVPGTTDYSGSIGQPYAKFGSYSLSFSSATAASVTITYPGGGYSGSPLVFVSMDTTSLDDMLTVAVKDINSSSFVIKAYAASAKTGSLVVYWMSVGV